MGSERHCQIRHPLSEVRYRAYSPAMSRHGLDSGKAITDFLHEIGTEVANIFQWFGELTDKSFGKVAPTGEDGLRNLMSGLF